MSSSVENVVEGSLLEAVQDETASHTAALKTYEMARAQYAQAAYAEARLEAERTQLKATKIARLVEGGLAYTPAEKQATLDPEYVAHLKQQRETVFNKENHRTVAEASLSRADMAVARLKTLAGVR